ncbi:MAG: phosphotransferase enzyme family protein, partial [Marinilabiliales bacterium]|nr:phosphotransferase enzyme family protein [Marinilabiliales bacterium]
AVLTVSVGSFSYKKGLPEDPHGNGGGFIFDCRALPNPGRLAEYQHLTGKDTPVITYLEQYPEVEKFLSGCMQLISQSVEAYLDRKFTHLSVSFGCTGGQHRSVYLAERMARFLQEKFAVNVVLSHREQA